MIKTKVLLGIILIIINSRMKKVLVLFAICLMSSIEPVSAMYTVDSPTNCVTDSSMIRPLYESGNHSYRIADTQAIPDMGNNQYAVSWYVDTEEWDFDPQTNHIFSKIEFIKEDTVLASFCDDDGWSYISVEDSKAKMFKSFRIDSNHTAVVFRGGAYAAGVPFLSIFVLTCNDVSLVFNQEFFIDKIENDKVFIKSGLEAPVCGYLSFMDGHVSIVSNEYPTGKLVY